MNNFWISLLTVVFISACGVDTSSSSTGSRLSPSQPGDVINPNPVDGTDPTDPTNPTDPTDPTDPTNPTDPTDPKCDPDKSLFECENALYDKYACSLGESSDGYTNNVLKDNSNDYLGENDEEDGLGVNSRYSYNADSTRTEVALYYYDLTVARFMSATSIVKDNYTISIDNAWAENDKNILYVRTPKDKNNLYTCYRYDVSSIDVDGSVTITKVYRLEE